MKSAPWRSARDQAPDRSRVVAAVVTSIACAAFTPAVASAGPGAAVHRPCGDRAGIVVTGVTLHVADRVGLSDDVIAEMRREATAVWRTAGLDVSWAREGGAGGGPRGASADGRASLTLVLAPAVQPDESVTAGARRLAAILFVDRVPTTVITAYPREVERLLAGLRSDDRAVTERPRILRDRLVGRVLGRSVAHELGHYVFGSPDHTDSGLMRRGHRLDAFVSPSVRPFRVVPPSSGCRDRPSEVWMSAASRLVLAW